MTSSATSTAGFIGNPKTPPPASGKPPRADASADGAIGSDNGFDAAFEAIRRYSREAAGKAPPDNSAEEPAGNWSRQGRDYATWTPMPDGADAPPAAGDLLLAGGALTPEGDGPGFDASQAAKPAPDHPPAGDADSSASPDAAMIAALAANAPVAAKTKAGITSNAVDKGSPPPGTQVAETGSGATREVASAAASRSDPFEDLRNLARVVDRQQSPAKPFVAPSDAAPDPEKVEIKSPELVLADRLPGSSSGTDRGHQGTARDAVTPPVNLTVVETRQFPGVAPSQTSVAAVVSAISGNESWNAMLRSSEAISATTFNQPGAPLNTLKIQLNPAELGSVNAVLRLSGDQLVVELKVETIEAYRQLSDSQNAVVKALKGQGYMIEQISIQQVAPDRPVPQQGTLGGQGNGQAAGEPQSQSGQDNLAQSGSGGTGQENGHEDGFESEGPGSVDMPGGKSSRAAADGAVYL